MSRRAFTSTNITYEFHSKDKAMYFNMNSKISHHSLLNHFSAQRIGICNSGVDDVLNYVTNTHHVNLRSKKNDKTTNMRKTTKDVYVIGSGFGEWSKSEKVYDWHATQLPIGTPDNHIQKKISESVVLRKVEGTVQLNFNN